MLLPYRIKVMGLIPGEVSTWIFFSFSSRIRFRFHLNVFFS